MLIRFVILAFIFVTLVNTSPSFAFDENRQHAPVVRDANKFTDIRIRLISPADKKIQCHQLTIQDKNWQKINFEDLPQNKHFCIRAWANIDTAKLSSNPSLLIGMLGASSFYWDNVLISENGEVGASKNTEIPGVITTLVRIPEQGLTNGLHLLSGEISTFHVGKELDSIGYVFTIVNEQSLYSSILLLSVLSAFLIGISFILAIIFQLIYWLYQKEVSYQIFSLFCFTSALILSVEQAKFWLEYTYDWHAFRLFLIYLLTFIASLLLPFFYLFSEKSPKKRIVSFVILLSLVVLSFVTLSYDETSSLLFFGSLVSALIINLYAVIYTNKDKVNVFIISLSLVFLYLIPDYFIEFGFSIVFIFVVMTMLIALIKEMQSNKLKALKAQRIKTELLRRNMQPHFLMNCLTQLVELIEVKPTKAVEFIAVLSDEFRQLTVQSDKKQVALSDEIKLCDNHLTIMSFRYLQAYQLIIEGDVSEILIPSSILHSQIENCFTHNEISSARAFKLIVDKRDGRISLILKTPIESRVNRQGTGLGEKYIKAKLAEVDQVNKQTSKLQISTFSSYEENKYWVSKYSFDELSA